MMATRQSVLFKLSLRELCGSKEVLDIKHRPVFLSTGFLRLCARFASSSQESVATKLDTKKIDRRFREKKATVYTCENIYKKWREDKTFYSIPATGVYATIKYIDTLKPCKNKKPPKTVMCIHGIPGNYSVFNHLINDLGNRGVRVIVPTFPDELMFGGKFRDELFRHTVEEKTQLLKDFLKDIGVSKLDCVVAHSSAIYPSLRLILDPELKVESQVLFNTGGHRATATMRPYWILQLSSMLHLNPFGRKLIEKLAKYLMRYIFRTPIKEDNLKGILLLTTTMVHSEFWKTREKFAEVARKQIPTLYCFSEDDKVVEKELSYEVVSILGASKEHISFYDEEGNLTKQGKDLPWLTLLSFEKGSHYVFRKYPDLCNQKIMELLEKL